MSGRRPWWEPPPPCEHYYYADPSGGLGWPSCVKCHRPAAVETARYDLRRCCGTAVGREHVPTCQSIDAQQRRAQAVPL